MALAGEYPKTAIYTVTITANPASGLDEDTLSVGVNDFEFAAAASPPFTVAYGDNARAAAANLVAAINAVGIDSDNYYKAEHTDTGAATTSAQVIRLTSVIAGFSGSDIGGYLDVASGDEPLDVNLVQSPEIDVPNVRDWIADLLASNQINSEVQAELLRPFGGALLY